MSKKETKQTVEETAVGQTEQPAQEKKTELTPEQERERALKRVKRLKKLKYGALATALTALFVAGVVVVNIIANVLNDRYQWNIDLTSSGLYEIDDKTVTYLQQLNTDIELVVMEDESLFAENSMLKVVDETLNRFQAEGNGHISVKYVDMTKDPDAVREYSQHYNGEIVDGDIVVAAGDLVRVVAFEDVIKVEQSIDYTTYSQITNYTFIGEQSLLAAIMGVTDLNPINVALLGKLGDANIYHGYESYNYQSICNLLEKNNYMCTDVDISADALDPAKYDMAVLVAPQNDLTQAQIDKLSAFLYNEGNYERKLLYFASSFQNETPNLDAFLETWGISVEDAVVYEGNDSSAHQVRTALSMLRDIPAVSLTDSEYAAKLANKNLPIVAPICRPLKLLYESNSGRTTEALLVTSDTAYLQPLTSAGEGETIDENDAETGEFIVAALGHQHNTVSADTFTSTVAVFGSWMFDINVAEERSYNNADYFVTVVNTMCGKENVITIAEKSLDTTSIAITAAQVATTRNIVVFGIPLLVAIIGFVVYLRRRNK
ncbi:MAG: Gldg family protein [Oscillospiraceae bacterium]